MIAYKPFCECPKDARPLGVLPNFPWQVETADETSVERGFIVISETDYTALVATLAPQNQMSMMKAYIESRIQIYRDKSENLLKDLYSENTLGGISAAQSNEMFDAYADVVLRLTEGAWPTAIARLKEKVPSGFVTQALIDKWIERITGNL